MLGVIVNVITVIIGACIGLLFKKGIPEKVSNAKRVREENLRILDEYVPGVAELMTKIKALKRAEKEMLREIAVLKKEASDSKSSDQCILKLERRLRNWKNCSIPLRPCSRR